MTQPDSPIDTTTLKPLLGQLMDAAKAGRPLPPLPPIHAFAPPFQALLKGAGYLATAWKHSSPEELLIWLPHSFEEADYQTIADTAQETGLLVSCLLFEGGQSRYRPAQDRRHYLHASSPDALLEHLSGVTECKVKLVKTY